MSEMNDMVGCILSDDIDGVRAMLRHGFDVKEVDGEYRCWTALHRAADRGCEEICRVLIEAGADLNAGDDMEQTPLHCAIEGNRCSTAMVLLEAGANPNVVSLRGETPLHLIAMMGAAIEPVMLAKILAAGADPHHVPAESPGDYLTPFQEAVRSDNAMFVRHCLDQNTVDLGQRSPDGRTLIELAAGCEETTALLLSAQTEKVLGDAVPVGPAASSPRASRGPSPF